MHLLHHQFAEIVEHVGEVLGLAASPGRYVLQDRLLAEIELHDLGHVAVDRLVVGDAGADRVCERDVAGNVGGHQPGHAERGVGPKRERIEKIVVDAAVDHVDTLQPFGRAHVDNLALDDQIASLDQLDAELVGQKRVFVIGGVVDAGGQQRDGWFGGGGEWRD